MTLNVQLPPLTIFAPDMLRLLEPLMVEPLPQKPVAGSEVAASPVKAAFKSSLKVSEVMSLRSKLLMVNVNGTLLPGELEAGNVMFTNGNCTVMAALAVDIVLGVKLPDS